MNEDDDLTRPVQRRVDSPQPKSPPPKPSGGHDDERTRVVGAQNSNVPEGWDPMERPVVGWLVVVEGVGKGSSLPLTYGQNLVGRGTDAGVRLIFTPGPVHREDVLVEEGGSLKIYRNEQWSTTSARYDPKMSRHQFNIIYEGKNKQFFIERSAGASSLTYLKVPGRDVFVSELVELASYARIVAGETELLFVPLCRPPTDDGDRGFDWQG